MRTGEGVLGFFPFESGKRGFGRALGKGYSDAQGLVAPATADIDFREVLSASGLRSWEFDHLVAWQGEWFRHGPHRLVEQSSPVVDLSAGWAAYERHQRQSSATLLQATARKRRKLERDHGPVTFVLHEANHALLEELLRWKSEQYRRSGLRDRFADGGVRRLVHDLLEVDDPELQGLLTVIRAGDEVVAMHMGLRCASTLAYWIPGYALNFTAYSPGLILCMDLLRAMTGAGMSLLDFGKGNEDYKRRIANATIPLLRGAVSHDRLTARLDALRRWPREPVKEFVLSSPTIERRVRGALARVGAARTRAAEMLERTPGA
jgi:CelD/BcsL family acetyltransferase involved in cellulose biosynthesis